MPEAAVPLSGSAFWNRPRTDEMLRHPIFLIPTFEGLHQAEHTFFSFDILNFWLGHIMAAFTSFAAQALGSSCHQVSTDADYRTS